MANQTEKETEMEEEKGKENGKEMERDGDYSSIYDAEDGPIRELSANEVHTEFIKKFQSRGGCGNGFQCPLCGAHYTQKVKLRVPSHCFTSPPLPDSTTQPIRPCRDT